MPFTGKLDATPSFFGKAADALKSLYGNSAAPSAADDSSTDAMGNVTGTLGYASRDTSGSVMANFDGPISPEVLAKAAKNNAQFDPAQVGMVKAQENIRARDLKAQMSSASSLSEIDAKRPNAGAASTAKGLITAVDMGAARMAAGFVQAYADATGNDDLSDSAATFAAKTRRVEQANDPRFSTALGAEAYEQSKGFAKAVPGLLATAANPILGAATFAADSAGNSYAELRAQGVNVSTAIVSAGAQGAIMGAMAHIPLGFISDKFGKTGITQFAAGLVARDVPAMYAQSMASSFVNNEALGVTRTFGDWLDDQPREFRQAALSAAVFSVGTTAGHAAARVTPEAVARLSSKQDQFGRALQQDVDNFDPNTGGYRYSAQALALDRLALGPVDPRDTTLRADAGAGDAPAAPLAPPRSAETQVDTSAPAGKESSAYDQFTALRAAPTREELEGQKADAVNAHLPDPRTTDPATEGESVVRAASLPDAIANAEAIINAPIKAPTATGPTSAEVAAGHIADATQAGADRAAAADLGPRVAPPEMVTIGDHTARVMAREDLPIDGPKTATRGITRGMHDLFAAHDAMFGTRTRIVDSLPEGAEGMVTGVPGEVLISSKAKISPLDTFAHEGSHIIDQVLGGDSAAVRAADEAVLKTLTPEAKAKYLFYYNDPSTQADIARVLSPEQNAARAEGGKDLGLTPEQNAQLADIFDTSSVNHTQELRADLRSHAIRDPGYWGAFRSALIDQVGGARAATIFSKIAAGFKAVLEHYQAAYANRPSFAVRELVTNHQEIYNAIARADAEYTATRPGAEVTGVKAGESAFSMDRNEASGYARRKGDQNEQRAETDRIAATGSGGLRDARGVRGGAESLALDQRAESSVRRSPLEGLPAEIKVDGKLVTFGPHPPAREAARSYMESAGLEYSPPTSYSKVDPARATRIAAEFESMAHAPDDPKVMASYDAMVKETLAQWQALKATGLKVEFINGADPYGNPRNAILDVVRNNHLWIFPTSDGFGGESSKGIDVSNNPLEAIVPGEVISGRSVQANDIFRAVHDYFGHVKEGVGFRADGEENAWQQHAAMYSDLARPAMTSETRGQNSWVNFGRFAEHNATADPSSTEYAPQKVGIMPEWTMQEGRVRMSQERAHPDATRPGAEITGVKAGESAFSTERNSNARINLEVAPDPNDRKLSDAWNSLPQAKRLDISRHIAEKIIPQILRVAGAEGRLAEQVGSYLDDTNPSFALILSDASKADFIAKLAGHVLAQDSMATISEEAFKGGDRVGVVTIDIGNADPKTIYDTLRGIVIDGNQPVGGQSTADGKMAILNYSDVSTPHLAAEIDRILESKYATYVDEVFAAFPTKEEYGYDSDRQKGATPAERTPVQRDADYLRAEATGLIRDALRAAGSKFSERRGATAPAGRDDNGGSADGLGRERASYGEPIEGSVGVDAVHYSSQPRDSLDSNKYGNGMRGGERKRLNRNSAAPAQEQRIHFYTDNGSGIKPESDVGGYAHTVRLNNLYDLSADPLKLREAARDAYPSDSEDAFNHVEQAIVARGFDGLKLTRAIGDMGVVVLLGKHIVGVDRVPLKTSRSNARAEVENTPEFKQWFGDSKVVDKEGKPLVVYHGTQHPFEDGVFRLGTAKWDAGIFATSSPSLAEKYAGGQDAYNIDGVCRALAKVSDRWFDDLIDDIDSMRSSNVYQEEWETADGPPPLAKRRAQLDDYLTYDYEPGDTNYFHDWVADKLGVARTAPVEEAHILPVYFALKNPLRIDAKGDAFDFETQTNWLTEAHEGGHDGLILTSYRDGTDVPSTVYVAFKPEQVKSATGNNGQFDSANPDIRYSNNRVDIPNVILGGGLGDLSKHPDYAAAKSGDDMSAIRVVRSAAKPAFVEAVRQAIGNEAAIIQPVIAIEASGKNKIPLHAAAMLGAQLDLPVGDQIVQSSSPKRTGLPGIERVFNRPEFAGDVEPGKRYFLVDDTVTQGGTFAALASYIEANGGKVVGAAALTGKEYSATLLQSDATLQALREKHGDIEHHFQAATGHGFDSLTESEARYITNFKPSDAVRDRIITNGESAQLEAGGDGFSQGEVNPPHRSNTRNDDEGTAHQSWPRLKDEISKVLRVPKEFLKTPLDRVGTAVISMSMGSDNAKVVATKFADQQRWSREQWNRFDKILNTEFTKDQQEKMWIAADEENDLRRDGITDPDRGLNRLTPAERRVVDLFHDYGESLLQRAKSAGMFDSDGVHYWAPRMVMMIDGEGVLHMPPSRGGAETGNDARNLRTTSSSLKQRKYLTSAETEAAAQGMNDVDRTAVVVKNIRTMPMAMGRLEAAIAGRELINQVKAMGTLTGKATVTTGVAGDPGYFTMNHPSFRKSMPEMIEDPVTGKMRPRLDENGDVVMQRTPIYVSTEFEGPLRAVLTRESLPGYQDIMSLKSKTMGLIMMSPLIHFAVEYGRSVPAMLTSVGAKDAALNLVTAGAYTYVVGNTAKKDSAQMRFAVEHGMVPIGGNGRSTDINGIADASDMRAGKSWTANALGRVADVASTKLGQQVRAGVDKAGEFWHQGLLWDRIADLQMGLFTTMHSSLINKGIDQGTAAYMAAHWANRYAGALPQEAMGQYARELANVVLFSRSFTLGNIGLMKDMVNGLPPNRQAMVRLSAIEASRALGKTDADASADGDTTLAQAKKIAKSKARMTVVLDIVLSFAANAILQNFLEQDDKTNTWGQIADKYKERLGALYDKVKTHPLEILQHPFDSIESLTPQGHNPEGKRNRVRAGDDKNGNTIYIRLPFGKVGEELPAYMTPAGLGKTLGSKLSPMVGAGFQAFNNADHFGHPIYDEHDVSTTQLAKAVGYFLKAQTPFDQLVAAKEVATGHGDEMDYYKAFGPFSGLTFSKVTGGDLKSQEYKAERDFANRKFSATIDARVLLKHGEYDAAHDALTSIGMSPKEATRTILSIENPGKPMSKAAQSKAYRHATDDQKSTIDELRDR